MKNDKCKIFFGNQYVKTIEVNGKRYTTRKALWLKSKYITKSILKTSAVIVSIAWVAVIALHIGITRAEVVQVEKEVIKEVRAKAPVMERIAKCESGGSHYDKSGQVVMRGNTNKTVDVGKYQINSVWYKKASELGLDITKESDNEAMAYWIYENRGTEDWYASKACWSK